MAHIHGKTRNVKRQDIFPVKGDRSKEHSAGIQQRSHHKQNTEETENAHNKRFSLQVAFEKQIACQHAAHAIGHHLPGSVGALRVEKVTGEGGNRTHQKAGFWAKGNTGNHNDGKNCLKAGDWNRHTGNHCQSAHYSDNHQFPGLGFATLEGQKEWDEKFRNHQGTSQVIPSAIHTGTQDQSGRHHD